MKWIQIWQRWYVLSLRELWWQSDMVGFDNWKRAHSTRTCTQKVERRIANVGTSFGLTGCRKTMQWAIEKRRITKMEIPIWPRCHAIPPVTSRWSSIAACPDFPLRKRIMNLGYYRRISVPIREKPMHDKMDQHTTCYRWQIMFTREFDNVEFGRKALHRRQSSPNYSCSHRADHWSYWPCAHCEQY